jgi:hypothetical protein
VVEEAGNLKKGCTRLAAASDKVYQLLAHGRWFSLGTPASSTTKFGRHDIAEILLKAALKLTAAVRKNNTTKNETDDRIEGVIKNWLKYASDRNGGRKARTCK